MPLIYLRFIHGQSAIFWRATEPANTISCRFSGRCGHTARLQLPSKNSLGFVRNYYFFHFFCSGHSVNQPTNRATSTSLNSLLPFYYFALLHAFIVAFPTFLGKIWGCLTFRIHPKIGVRERVHLRYSQFHLESCDRILICICKLPYSRSMSEISLQMVAAYGRTYPEQGFRSHNWTISNDSYQISIRYTRIEKGNTFSPHPRRPSPAKLSVFIFIYSHYARQNVYLTVYCFLTK